MNRPALFSRLPLAAMTILALGFALSAQATTVYQKKKGGVNSIRRPKPRTRSPRR